MPEISRFLGIIITMYYNDHAPPHFHAIYGDHEAKIDIASGGVIAGRLPRRAMSLVWEWCDAHRDELIANWEQAERRVPLNKIEPLE
jgi:hypothetical protein